VDIHAYADRIVIRQDGRTVAERPRCYGRGETVYDPWHYVPVLARKPGALRNGAPFKDWVLPAALDRVRRRLASSHDGDRQMVKILAAVLSVRPRPGQAFVKQPGVQFIVTLEPQPRREEALAHEACQIALNRDPIFALKVSRVG
jgi:hypothetical protein